MNKKVSEMTKVGDPMFRLKLPSLTVQSLKAFAKQNKRRTQDQFIKALAETFRKEEAFAVKIAVLLPDLQDVY